MITHYIKIAWRFIAKHKFYSLVNVVGLVSGISFTLLIGGYIWQEFQINRDLPDADRQYILTTESKDPNIGINLTTFGPIAKRLQETYPTLVEDYYRWDGITSIVSKGDKHFREGLQVGDSNLFNMYGFELLHGNTKTALLNPYSVVITKDRALKYFGRTDVVGELIDIQSFSSNRQSFIITGVLKDIKENSVTHLVSNDPNTFYIPINTLPYFGRMDVNAWGNIFIPSYIKLRKGVDPKQLEDPLRKLVSDNADETVRNLVTVKPVLLTDYYLNRNGALVKKMLYILSFVGFFILLMAVINFVNLSISRSTSRMKEIGIRKVLGGIKRQLIFQFLAESIILVGMATIISLGVYKMLSPLFSELVGKQVPSLSAFPLYFLLVPALLILIVGTLAGLYPALVLSSFKSIDTLKGKLSGAGSNALFRKSLVGFQFSIAIVVLVAAAIIAQQVSFFFGKNLGYDKEYVVSAQVPRDWTREGVERMLGIRNQFLSLPQVKSVSMSFEIPDNNNAGQVPVYRFGNDSTSSRFLQLLRTDEHYLNTFSIPLAAGAFFEGSSNDSGKVVINETALPVLGYQNAEEAIGQQVRIPGDRTIFSITGVVKDFHFGSMQQKIQPILLFNVRFSPNYRYFSFKIKPGNIQQSITAIQNKWASLMPQSSFEYKFMDDTLTRLYASEIQLKKAAFTSSGLALLIVLLGILGLVSLSIQKRVKEIGIRKVVGASLPDIIFLFLKEFMIIIFIAGLIACPVAYLLMTQWLDNYNYRIEISLLTFILAIAALCSITLLLIVARTTKAAMANPVTSLRTE